jgi:hypothetical protein
MPLVRGRLVPPFRQHLLEMGHAQIRCAAAPHLSRAACKGVVEDVAAAWRRRRRVGYHCRVGLGQGWSAQTCDRNS